MQDQHNTLSPTDNGTNLQDHALLRAYVDHADEAAFAKLVGSYAGFVYSAALRQLRNADAAEEVTQAVFIVLARKAGSIQPNQLLGAWLFKAVRYAAYDHAKREARRSRHEREAAQLASTHGDRMSQELETAHQWDAIAPLLDAAIDRLSGKLRSVVLLRYFQGYSHEQIATQLGISQWTARQRLSRSLEQMRRFFQQRGIVVPSAAIEGLISVHAVGSAPAALIASTTKAALTGAASAPIAATAKGVLIMMTVSKAKLSAICIIIALFLTSTSLLITHTLDRGHKTIVLPTPIPIAATSPPETSGAVTGVVRDASGKPLAGAEVIVEPADQTIYIDQTPPFLHPTHVTTDSDGRFSAPKPAGGFVLAVRHSEGVATLNGSDLASYDITLNHWGRVEGTFRIGSEAKSGVPIYIDLVRASDAEPTIQLYNSIVKTAQDGTFVFPRVPAGRAVIARMIDGGAGQYTQIKKISILPGQKTVVALGGDGTAVIGTAVTRFQSAGSTPPRGLRASVCLRAQDGRAADSVFYGTIDPNGAFRVDDVPAGRYLLTLNYSQPKPGGALSDRIEVATASKALTVPPKATAPLDVGTLDVLPSPRD